MRRRPGKSTHCDCGAALVQPQTGGIRYFCDGCNAARKKLLAHDWYLAKRHGNAVWTAANKARAKRWRQNRKPTGRPTVCAALGEVFSR